MKKIFCIILAIMLFAMLTACGCSTDANVEGGTGNNAGDNGRMYGDDIIDGDNERTNDGSMNGGASADFSISGGTDNGGNNGRSSSNGSTNGSGRNMSSFEKGELSQLASLIGADDFKVIEKLGEGNPDTIISGNTAIVRRRTYRLPLWDKKENVILSYDSKGLVNNIEISPDYAPVLWTMNISKEYGVPDKISSEGLDYDYYAVWRSDKNKTEIICWNNKLSVQISEA